jgi:hypothetical protein
MSIQNNTQARNGFQPCSSENTSYIDSKKETLNKLQKVQEAVALIGKAIKSPTRTLNAGCTLFNGIINLFSGNPLRGAAQTCVGGIELYLVLSQNQTSNMKELLDDTEAGLEMIQQLENENAKSLKSLQQKLTVVNKGINALSTKLDEVKNIASDGNAKLAKLKVDAEEKYKTALDSQLEALYKLTEVKSALENGNEILLEARGNIQALQNKAKEPASAQTADLNQQFEQFQALSGDALTSFSKAEQFFNTSSSLLMDGIDLIQKAAKDQNTATEAAITAVLTAKNTLDHVINKVEHQDELEKTKTATKMMKQEMSEMAKRNLEKDAMLADAQENIQEAKEIIAFGLQSMILGGGLGAFVGPFVGVPSCFSAPAGVALYHDIHQGGPVSKVAKAGIEAIDAQIRAKPAVQPEKPVVQTENLALTFNAKSTGWLGWLRGQRSQTEGALQLSIAGTNIFECRVNFNHKKPMSVSDIQRLVGTLSNLIKKNPTTAEEIQKLINELKSTSVERYQGKKKEPLMSPKTAQAYFGELERSIKKSLRNK